MYLKLNSDCNSDYKDTIVITTKLCLSYKKKFFIGTTLQDFDKISFFLEVCNAQSLRKTFLLGKILFTHKLPHLGFLKKLTERKSFENDKKSGHVARSHF